MTKTNNRELLIVDVDTFSWQLLNQELSHQNFTVHNVEKEENAISFVRNKTPECILINTKIPGINGHELARKINNINSTVPILLLIGFPDLEKTLSMVGNTIYDYIIKPFKTEQIRLIIERAQRENELKNELSEKTEKIKALEAEKERLQNMLKSVTPSEAPVVNPSTNLNRQNLSQKRMLNTYRQQSLGKSPKSNQNIENT